MTEQGYRLRKIFRDAEDHGVFLAETGRGEARVCRLYRRAAPAYAALVGKETRVLPTVYRCDELAGGVTLVEEEYVDGARLSDLLGVYHPDDS